MMVIMLDEISTKLLTTKLLTTIMLTNRATTKQLLRKNHEIIHRPLGERR